MLCLWKKSSWRCPEMVAQPGLAASFILISFTLLCFTEGLAAAQSWNAEKGVPILSGSAGAFSFVTAGQQRLDAQINPCYWCRLAIAGWWNRGRGSREHSNDLRMAAPTAVR